jgi:hypothetical protein
VSDLDYQSGLDAPYWAEHGERGVSMKYIDQLREEAGAVAGRSLLGRVRELAAMADDPAPDLTPPEQPLTTNICLFMPGGRTFSFKDVDVVLNNETVLVFRYRAMSDGLYKTGTFFKANFVGYSIHAE